LTGEEIRSLAASPIIEIGAHTVSHPILPALSHAEQRREVEQGRRVLEDLTGTSVTSFSYPHGVHSPATLSIVAEAGFTVACCSTPDVVRRTSEPLALPRLWVADQAGEAFARWLDRWLPPESARQGSIP
jgi:peptidoglycan/xylan/chitin deacetylase (PgdA/CDA1 family)